MAELDLDALEKELDWIDQQVIKKYRLDPAVTRALIAELRALRYDRDVIIPANETDAKAVFEINQRLQVEKEDWRIRYAQLARELDEWRDGRAQTRVVALERVREAAQQLSNAIENKRPLDGAFGPGWADHIHATQDALHAALDNSGLSE